jgi:predicted nucleic acid-binding protein
MKKLTRRWNTSKTVNEFIVDTNILIHLAKDNSLRLFQQINPDNRKVYISVVTIAELKTIGATKPGLTRTFAGRYISRHDQ